MRTPIGYAVAVVTGLVISTPAGAATPALTYGPILGRGVTPDQMIVKWGTSSASDATSVSYRASGSGAYTTVTGATAKDHEVVLTGLSIGAAYDYYVQSGTLQSSTATFSTCPVAGMPFDVVFYGDNRDGASEHAKIVAALSATAPEIVLSSGDIRADGSYSGYLSEVFPVLKSLVATTTYMAVPGNHDNGSTLATNFGLVFPAPRASGAAWQPYYSFSCGNAMFIGLNSNDVGNSAQKTFLTGRLTAAKGDASIDHVFVWYHHAAYSSAMHGDTSNVRSTWVPLLDDPAAKVKAVFSGHDHAYERLNDSSKVTYIVSGGAGADLYGKGSSSAAASQYFNSTYNFVKLHIVGGLVTGNAYNDAGGVIDSFSMGSPTLGDGGAPPDLALTGGAADLAGAPATGTDSGTATSGNDGSSIGITPIGGPGDLATTPPKGGGCAVGGNPDGVALVWLLLVACTLAARRRARVPV